MTATDLISITEAVLESAGSAIHGAAFGSPENLKRLVDLGVLVPTGNLAEVACEECDEHHMASIIVTDIGTSAVCLRTGLEFTPEQTLMTYEIRVEPLVNALAEDLDRKSCWAQPRAAPFIWSLGSFAHLDLQVGVYVMLNAGNLERLSDAIRWLKREPRLDAIAVLTNDRRDICDIALPWNGRVIRLADYVCLDSQGGWVLDRTRLAEHVIPPHLLGKRGRGRPNSAYSLAAELIPEVDRGGALRAIRSKRGRHRAVLVAAKARDGASATLSIGPCEEAFQDYLRNGQFSGN